MPEVSRFQAWMAFIRPKTFGVAVAPVIAALALVALETHQVNRLIALFTMSIALVMQIITNMENDLGYTERKAEVGNRKGLPRATANGWISIPVARWAIRVMMGVGLLNTLLLVYWGGWGFLAIGVASIVAAYTYMGGPKPIAYTPWGEFTVMLFFGLTAVVGTYFLQTHTVSVASLLLGLALGAIAASVLAVNNFRDREHDLSVNRHTLAVVLSETTFHRVFAFNQLLPYFLVGVMVALDPHLRWGLLTWASLPLALKGIREIKTHKGLALNDVMFGCIKLELAFSALFAIGMLLGTWA